jgi:hypothetical protein
MRFGRLFLFAVAVCACGAVAQAAPFGYTLDITTGYGFSNPFGGTPLNGNLQNPDTGFVQVKNNGTTTFTGTFGTTALSQFGGDFSFSAAVTLASGQAASIAIGDEASNVGGFNGPFGSPQPGVTVYLNGFINATEAVSLSVDDSNIHSGAPRSGCDGISSDSYVLQGGAPTGCDNGDDFEVSQAQGNFRFFEAGPSATPEPGAYLLFGTVIAGLALRRHSLVKSR